MKKTDTGNYRDGLSLFWDLDWYKYLLRLEEEKNDKCLKFFERKQDEWTREYVRTRSDFLIFYEEDLENHKEELKILNIEYKKVGKDILWRMQNGEYWKSLNKYKRTKNKVLKNNELQKRQKKKQLDS